jgi:hypothetical protein
MVSCRLVSLVVVEDLERGAPAHVVDVVAPAVVVGDERGVGFGAELADGEKVPAVKGRPPALLEHGALEPFAHGVVVGGTSRDAHVSQPLGRQGVDEGAGFVLGTVECEDRSAPICRDGDRDAVPGEGSGRSWRR